MIQRVRWVGVIAGLALLATAVEAPSRSPGSGGSLIQLPGHAGCLRGPSFPLPQQLCRTTPGLDGIADIAISPDGRNLYAAMPYRSGLLAFARDPTTGTLRLLSGRRGCIRQHAGTRCTRARAFGGPTSVAVSPNGRRVYVVANGSSAISVFRRDLRTGALRQLAGQGGCISNWRGGGCLNGRRLDGARAIAIAPNGRNIYVTADYFGVVALKDTGRLVQLPGRRGCVVEEDRACTPGRTLSGDEAKSITLSPDGRHAYVAAGHGPRSSPRATLAVLKRIRGGGLRELPGRRGCLAVRPPGDRDRFRTQPTCPERRAFGGTAASAITPNGRLLYVTGNNSIATFRRNRRSGALSQPRGATGCVSYEGRGGCTPSPNLRAPTDIAVAPDGLHVYVASRFAVSVYMRRGTTLRRVRGRAGCANVNGRAGCTDGRGLYDTELNVTPSADGRHLYTGVGGDCCDLDGRLVIFGFR